MRLKLPRIATRSTLDHKIAGSLRDPGYRLFGSSIAAAKLPR